MRIIGGKMYDVCKNCGKIICLNKFLFGSLHICATEEEQIQFSETIQQTYQYNKKRLEEAK